MRNRTGVHQPSAPVRGGFVCARVLKECSTARLVDTAGKDPLPGAAACRWYDGSIKWLLVDTRVSVPVEGEVPAPAAGPGTEGRRRRVWVAQRAEGIFVNTGPARFLFPAKRFGLPGPPGPTWTAMASGTRRWSPAAASSSEVEHQAPGPPEEENWLRDAAAARASFTAAPTGDYRVTVESAIRCTRSSS